MALSKIDVANMLTGATPVANGGTALTSGTSGQFLKFTGSTTLASAADNAGKVLQVVSSTLSSYVDTSSTSYADTGLDVAITPSATSSKILVLVSHTGLLKESSNNAGKLELGRTISGGSYSALRFFDGDFGRTASTALSVVGGSSTSLLDSPNTTSAITYKTRFACSVTAAATIRVCQNNCVASITAMEISA